MRQTSLKPISRGKARFGASLAQGFNEALPIRIIKEDWFAPVAAIHDVIDRAGIFDSQLARHDGRVPSGPLYVNIKNRPLYVRV